PQAEIAGPQDSNGPGGRPERRLVLGREPGRARDQRGSTGGTGSRRVACPLGSAELDDHVTACKHRGDLCIPYPALSGKVRAHVHARRDLELARRRGRRLDRAAHAPRGADEDDADHACRPAAAPSAIPTARAASSTAFSVAGSIGTSGSRSSFAISPISESRYLIGPGFDSRNAARNSGMSFWCATSASPIRPARARSMSVRIGFGAAWPTTETMPSPPTAAHASVSESSPESSVSFVFVFTCAIWSRFPE